MDAKVPAGSQAPASSSGSAATTDSAKLNALVDRFVALDDVVAQELADLEYPWKLQAIEDRIQEYSIFNEDINSRLSARVMQNYSEFAQGMQQVQAVETELTLIGVLIKNSRRKLQERDQGVVRGSMQITRQHRKRKHLEKLLQTLGEFQGVVQMDRNLRQCLDSERYCEAISQHAALRDALASDKFKQFPGLLGLREGLGNHWAEVQRKLSDGLKSAAVSAEFHPERYKEILKAYSMMSSDQALTAGKELLRHTCDFIVAVSKQCMLAFSAAPADESPADWHRKALLKDLGRCMDPTHFVACTAQLYEHLCNFLYRHQFLCAWHVTQAQIADGDACDYGSGFREVLRDVLTELVSSKRIVWERVQQQVSLVLMTLDFQYPALTEDSFLHILHLTQMLIEEGDQFMSDYQASRNPGSATEGKRQWSSHIRGTLKTKAHEYFQSMHLTVWTNFKVAYIEQDTWQRLPVPRTYRLIRMDWLRNSPIKQPLSSAVEGQKVRTTENNPFRNYKPEPLWPVLGPGSEAPADTDEQVSGKARREISDDIDEHALLRHWIDESDSVTLEKIGSSMLSNSNSSPVVSSSTVEMARILERYFRMMSAMPQLALDIFQSANQLIDFYVNCVLCTFVQDRHLRMLLEDLEIPAPAQTDGRVSSRHETFLLQQLCPELRRAAVRTNEFVSSLTLPESCAACFNVPPSAGGAALMRVSPFPKLTSPSSLCGLAERCVGVESVGALLSDLRDVQQWLSTLLPRDGSHDTIEHFLCPQEVACSQLRTFILMCAARDILEAPDVGRVSLEHFSNTLQALKWDAKDFSNGSPAAPYLDQLRGQIDELARRIPCAGGGSIPYMTQRLVWGWVEVRIMHECVEVIAKCAKKKSQEALYRMAEDFQTIRTAVQQNFASIDKPQDNQLLHANHPLACTVSWKYLDQYLEVHASIQASPNDALLWYKRHPQYPMRLLKVIGECIQQANPKQQKQYSTDLETFLADYIVSESLGHSQHGL